MGTETIEKVTCNGCGKKYEKTIATSDGSPMGQSVDQFKPQPVEVRVDGVILGGGRIACSTACARTIVADIVEKWPAHDFDRSPRVLSDKERKP